MPTVKKGRQAHLFAQREIFLNVDGASKGNPGPSGAGVVIKSVDGIVLAAFGNFLGKMTNNQAEYRALIGALEKAKSFRPAKVRVLSDSQLLVRQMLGQYKIKNEGLKRLAACASRLVAEFQACQFTHVPRADNAEADRLANLAIKAGKYVEE